MESNSGSIHEEEERRTTHRSRCLDKISFFIYLSHFLSSFGDRIWQFAVGLYLYYIYPCSLTLTAVYGLATCGSLFILGAPVGRWVDKSKRLKAAQISIFVQNTAVVLCATVMSAAIYYKIEISTMWNGHFEYAIYAVIIILEIIGELASMANKLLLEKDWIVVLAHGDERKLSNLNATMRTINLSCKVLAPFVVGHLLHFASYLAGAIFIASWNVVSAIAEYYLLYLIFALVPELGVKRTSSAQLQLRGTGSGDQPHPISSAAAPLVPKHISQLHNGNPDDSTPTAGGSTGGAPTPEAYQGASKTKVGSRLSATTNGNMNGNANGPPVYTGSAEKSLAGTASVAPTEGNNSGDANGHPTPHGDNHGAPVGKCGLGKSCHGWTAYFNHPVRFAGLGLASLYMTVLSFDYVTIGYLSSQGVSAALSGNLTAFASLVGILGSLSFPFFRKRMGKNKAGMFGFAMETICLFFCVASIIAPGSPFNPQSIGKFLEDGSSACDNQTEIAAPLSVREQWEQHSNVFFLVFGIIFARYGLWIADLSVTQIFQENVKESQRGAVGGVQGALNQLMSLVKFGLTIVLPYPETFGYLICLSWLFVFLGFVFFSVYVCHDRHVVKPADILPEQVAHMHAPHTNSKPMKPHGTVEEPEPRKALV